MGTLVQPYHSRFHASEDVDGLRVSIPGQWSWALLFPLFWLCAWTAGGLTAGASLFRRFNFFILFWMMGWAFGEVAVGYMVLYGIGGRLLILANAENLTLRTEIFRLGWSKSYMVREMRNLRFQPEIPGARGKVPSRIAFEYGTRTISFATGLAEAEAQELISRIRQRCAIPGVAQASGIKFWGQ
jgi:hypothetical protein